MNASGATGGSGVLGLTVPIVNAPMGGVAGGRLARAVTEAGGLGMIGMGSAASPQSLHRELAELGVCDRFGIGLVGWVVDQVPALLELALDAEPLLLSMSFGTDYDWVEAVHRRGVLAATQVYDVTGARRAADAGVDVIVARGSEGGGHGAPVAQRAALLEAVLQAVDRPVLAAGGIATRSDLDSVVAAGAAGAWIGTAFAACSEALTPPRAKQAMIAAGSDDTVVTRAFDRALGLPWAAHFPARVLRNRFTDQWHGRDGPDPDADVGAGARVRRGVEEAIRSDDPARAPVDAGQGVGAVSDVVPAATVVRRLVAKPPGPV